MTTKVAQRIYPRGLNLAAALKSQSSFLLGPRMTGKSTLIRETLPDALVFDLLNSEDFLPLLESPSFLGRTIPSDTEMVVIDEIQKAPKLLDVAHYLIQKKNIKFALTGSSIRKLKHGSANLLAGRALSIL